MTLVSDASSLAGPGGYPAVGTDDEIDDLLARLMAEPLPALLKRASRLRDDGHGRLVTYSRKVFIPLTRLCRDVCGYCTFATSPRNVPAPYLTPDEVLAVARSGEAAGCHEALFTLGDKPELRYGAARRALRDLGYDSTIAYLTAMCELVIRETGLLPHVNPGVMSAADIALLRGVSISHGLMLESASDRLCGPGGAHFGSPDKRPIARLATIEAAGRAKVPFTSGILIGIGETRRERIAALVALRDAHRRHGHIQEIIVQNFRAKAGTRMADADEPGFDDLLWTAAAARIVLGPEMNIQVPPNLSYGSFPRLLEAGINDWGGVSPVTPDHVNPEAPWPDLDRLAEATEGAGFALAPRLAAYPAYVKSLAGWQDPRLHGLILRHADAGGLAREDSWITGQGASPPPALPRIPAIVTDPLASLLAKAAKGERLAELDIQHLFAVRGGAVDEVCGAADSLRRRVSGDTVRYVVNRNLNYTNICSFRCRFCAFSKGKGGDQLRGKPYDLALDEVARRAREAWDRGATEICMQGGIHPDYDGHTYLALLRAVKDATPAIHVHAFSPLEVSHGAATLGLSLRTYLVMLRDAGLGSLPGTAAEILDDHVRAVICPDKLSTAEWLEVVRTAHEVGLRTTATIMFGHMEAPDSWARHILAIRDLGAETGGFTEFVPLPFVHMEAPMYLKGEARRGPTWREVRLMHAVARLALHPVIPNIQGSWVKLGHDGVREMLRSGANDLGGTLMNESISRAAGTEHGQELPPADMERLIRDAGRTPAQRTTLYGTPDPSRRESSLSALALADIVLTPPRKRRVTGVPQPIPAD